VQNLQALWIDCHKALPSDGKCVELQKLGKKIWVHQKNVEEANIFKNWHKIQHMSKNNFGAS